MKSFQEKVIEVVKKIPKGKVLTYAQVASYAGNIKAVRAVGTIMAKNQDTTIPCHRVVKSDGSVGMYNRLLGKNKKILLEKEGIIFDNKWKVAVW